MSNVEHIPQPSFGRSLQQTWETKSQKFLSSLLEKPFVQNHILPHIPHLVQLIKGDPELHKLNGGLLYLLGAVTLTVPGDDVRNKSIPLRTQRAETLKEIQQMRSVIGEPGKRKPEESEQLKKLFERERNRKRLTEELYAHKQVTVDLKYGTLGGQVSVLNPEASGTPIVIIPGSSNDPESIESWAVELALQTGKKVYILGYPDAPNGVITEEFANAVITDTTRAQKSFQKDPKNGTPPTYEAYKNYFQSMIEQVCKEHSFILGGYSAGGAIVAKLLSDQKYQQIVENAFLINPAGSATVSDTEFRRGLISQSLHQLADGIQNLFYTWWEDPRNPKTDEDKRRKFKTWEALGNGTHYRISDWETMKVQPEGKIIVFSGGKDPITESERTFSNTRKPDNDQMSVVYDPHAHHSSVCSRPQPIIASILTNLHL